MYWLVLLDHFTITWPLVVIAFLECMAVSWVYGVDNLLDNAKVTGVEKVYNRALLFSFSSALRSLRIHIFSVDHRLLPARLHLLEGAVEVRLSDGLPGKMNSVCL